MKVATVYTHGYDANGVARNVMVVMDCGRNGVKMVKLTKFSYVRPDVKEDEVFNGQYAITAQEYRGMIAWSKQIKVIALGD